MTQEQPQGEALPPADEPACVAALRELVALEDLKKSLAEANHHASRFPTDENYAVIDRLSVDIGRRRPIALAAARAALASLPAAAQPESGYGLPCKVVVKPDRYEVALRSGERVTLWREV